ncbi:MAG: hypothetical protein Q9160_008870 [Pyrenula sp. 1 TL-2023]
MEYPFASSPDVLRTHEKDAFITSTLSSQSSEILRALFGVRTAHQYSSAISHLTELLYLSLTTLIGNRTLGEEYCDVVQVEDDTLKLVSLARRVGYVASVVLTPWTLSRVLPALRRRLRTKLERNIERALQRHGQMKRGAKFKIQQYILEHLDFLTSPSPIYALSLATFYFTGAYYHISKRLFGLRYIFTKQIRPGEQRIGYEVLGFLLVLQLTVQGVLHAREVALENAAANSDPVSTAIPRGEVTKDSDGTGHIPSAGKPMVMQGTSGGLPPKGVSFTTQTPVLDHPRYTLADEGTMDWIPNGQQRKCTLCLEPFRDPSVTSCGHVFCWTCVQDWVKEKAECPLCRQDVLPQKILPLRS